MDQILLTKADYGFLPIKSCLSYLLETLDFITDSLADGMVAREIILDFAQAFNLVTPLKTVPLWNELPENVIPSSSLYSFKSSLGKHYR